MDGSGRLHDRHARHRRRLSAARPGRDALAREGGNRRLRADAAVHLLLPTCRRTRRPLGSEADHDRRGCGADAGARQPRRRARTRRVHARAGDRRRVRGGIDVRVLQPVGVGGAAAGRAEGAAADGGGADQARIQGADLVGQPLGGALFGVSRLLPFAADAISYAVSVGSLFFIRTAFQEERPRSVTRLRAEMLEGVRWLWHQPFMRAGVLLVAGSNFAFSAMILALIVRAKSLGASSATVGVMLAFLGGGAILGSLVAPWVQRRVHAKVIMIGSFWVWALGAFVSAFLENAYALGAVWAVGGIFGPIFNVAFSTYRYALVPDRLLARVGSAALVVAWGAIPLGQLTAGFLLEQIGGVKTILVVAALSASVGLAASVSRTIRSAPRAEELLSSA